MGYKTEQRSAVIEFLKQNRDRHFTVSEIADSVKSMGAGKSTVYRHISNLYEAGVIRRFETGNSKKFVYQYADTHDDCDNHYHLKCAKCGRLIHMDCAKLSEVAEHIKSEHNFILGNGRAILYGKCVRCTGKR